MASMSYCRFENTLGDFSSCVEDMREAIENGQTMKEFLSEMSEYEKPCVKALFEECFDFIDLYRKLERK